MNLIGREKEIKILEQVLLSKKPEFVALYGRRRVGKTYLVQQSLSKTGIYFECTGIKDGSLRDQLLNFNTSFIHTFYPGAPLHPPQNWREAFERLTFEIKKVPVSRKVIIFLDELPWLATAKSQLLQSLDYFWNTQWIHLSNFKLIVCGSAASWMLGHLINAKGGLHNRLTKSILLEPFTLKETKQYLTENRIKATEKQLLDLYMVMGGIPYYLNHIDRSKSFSQNINDLCFKKDGLLYSEFTRIFKSLFDASELNLRIVKEIAKRHYGISFVELLEKTGKKAGGRFKDRLQELEAAGFIQCFLPYGRRKRDHYYKVIDPYTLFYLHWIDEIVEGSKLPKETDYWTKISQSAAWFSWAGYAYEVVCYTHADKIIQALGLEKISCLVSQWKLQTTTRKNEDGAQIDLLFDREDNAITLCEVKYSKEPFVIDKAYAKSLVNKMTVFENHLKKEKQIFLAMVTTGGLKRNIWSEDLVTGVVELKDFFK